MIKLTNTYGKTIFLAVAAIAEVLEASDSSQWHGTRAYIRTFDGRTLELQQSAQEIAKLISAAGKSI